MSMKIKIILSFLKLSLLEFSTMYRIARNINDTNLVVSPPKKNCMNIPRFKYTRGFKLISLFIQIAIKIKNHRNLITEKYPINIFSEDCLKKYK